MRLQTALFSIAALAATGVAQADTAAVPAATQKAVTALYQPICNAVEDPSDKNLDAAFAALAPDFVAVDFKGKAHKRDEVVASQRMQLKQIEADDCTSTFGSITQPDPSTLVVMATLHVTGSVQGNDGKHQLDATNTSSDTWKLVSGSWQESQSKLVRALIKVDGNVVDDEGN